MRRPHIIVVLLLTFIVTPLKRVLQPLLALYSIIRASFKWELGDYLWECLKSQDANGGVIGMYLWNDIMITKNGYKFGKYKEVMSSVYGKNQIMGELIVPGKLIANGLDLLDKNHCFDSVDLNV